MLLKNLTNSVKNGWAPRGDKHEWGLMPEVIFPGPEGRLEGRYHPQKTKDAPIAIILHPHPQFGGTMNNRVVYKPALCVLQHGLHSPAV